MGAPVRAMQDHDWAGEMGERWNAYLEQCESMISPVGDAAIRFASFEPGEVVIDVGCGGGITSFQIAGRVGSSGHVTGLDVSEPLVSTARRRAAERDLKNVDFIHGDAAWVAIERSYDHLFSRFGVMFFEDPHAAFAHMRGFVRAGGRVSLCCWGPPVSNPWVFDLLDVARAYVELPLPDPRAPGPFAFSDTTYVEDILVQAGFHGVRFTAWKGDQLVGGLRATPETAADFLMDALFMGEALRNESDSVKARARQDLVRVLEPYRTDRGVVLGAHAWLISAMG